MDDTSLGLIAAGVALYLLTRENSSIDTPAPHLTAFATVRAFVNESGPFDESIVDDEVALHINTLAGVTNA